ncbi:MAG: GAF domain-containing protein [Chloroflexi bacterium]|nr:GAF domain-containing protein [Chloroflexota bacterium]
MMLVSLRRFFASPVFADEEQTRVANLLNIIALAMLGMIILAAVVVIPIADDTLNTIFIFVALLIPEVLSLILLRRGQIKQSAYVITIIIWIILSLIALFYGGVENPSSATLILTIILGSLLLGGRVGLLFAGLNITFLTVMLVLEYTNQLPTPLVIPGLINHYITHVINFLMAGLLLYLVVNNLNKAIKRANENEQALKLLNSSLEQRVVERTRALEASAEVSRRLSTILNPDQLVLEVVEQVKTAYNYYHAHIYLLGEKGQTLRMVGGTGEAGKRLLEKGHAISMGQGVVGRAAQLKQGILVPDTSKEAGWLANPLLPDTKAEIAVPILLGGQVIGVLDVQDDVADDVFPEDVELLQAIANQMAVALQNARQHEETQRLFQASQALAAATDHQSILDAFMHYGTPLADQGGLLVFNHNAQNELLSVEYAAAWSRHSDRPQPIPTGTHFAPERVPFLSSLISNQPLIVTDVNERTANPQAVTAEVVALLVQFEMQAMVSLPLIFGGQRIGSLLIGYAEPHTFSQQELQPAQTLANQIAILLQNQRLLEDAQTALKQLDNVNRHLTGQAWQEFGQLTGDIRVEDVVPGTADESAKPLSPAAELTAPILVRGEAIGRLSLQHLNSDLVFSEDDHTLVQEVASEVAIALENVRLVEQTRRNAAALEESRNLLDSVVENLPLLLFVKDAQELRYVRWNKAGEEMLGISASEVLGKNAYDSFAPEEADRFTAQDRAVLQHQDSLDIAEETVVTPRGTRILHTRKTPVFGPDGQPQYLVGLSDDITERKQAEQALQDLEALYRRAIAAADAVPYSRRYQDETFTFVGEQIETLTGYPASEFTAPLFDSLIEEIITHENDTATPAEAVQIARSGKIAHWKADYRIRGRDGQERWLADTSVEVLGPDGLSTGSVGILTDITERKRAERALSRQLVEMETLNAVGQILTTEKSLDEILSQVGQLLCTTFRVDTGRIALYDSHAQLIRNPFALHEGNLIQIDPQPLGGNLSSLVIQSRQPLHIQELNESKMRELGINQVRGNIACWIGVPILSGDELMGVISLQQATEPDWFNERDIRLLVTVANNLSTAIQNIRLFTQTQDALAELEALTRRLTHEGWQSYLTESVQEKLSYSFDGDRVVSFESNGTSALSPLTPSSEQTYVQSVTIHGQQIGRLVAEDIDGEMSEFQAVIAAVSQGLSTHIDNLRLNEQTERALAEARKRSEELNVLNEMGRALTTAIHVDDIIQHLRVYLPQLLPANDFYVALNLPESNEIEIRVFINGEPYSHFRREWSNGVTEYMLQNRQPLFIRGNLIETAEEKGFQVIGRPTQAFMGMPMMAGQETLGVIATQHEDNPHMFNENHFDLLTAFASQTAIAISNVHLLTHTRARAEELALINRVVSSVASSLDIRQSMQIVAQELGRAAAVEQIGIALFNEDRTALTVIAELFDPNRSVTAIGFVIPVEGNLSTQEVIQTRKPLIIKDALNSPLTAAFHDGLRFRGVQSLAIFPMIVGNELIGTVGVDILEPGRVLTANQMRLVETIVYQASIAVDNARLFEQTEQALKEVRTLYDVSIHLNAARTLPEALLALTEPAINNGSSASGMFTFELDEQDQPQWGVVAAAWQRTGPPPIPVGTRFYLPDFPTANLWLENPNKVVFFEDMYTDERVDAATQALYRQSNAQAAIWIPLVAQNHWLGLIYISWSEVHRFSQGERRLYESLRTQGVPLWNTACSTNNHRPGRRS